jgi:hypothetical protein
MNNLTQWETRNEQYLRTALTTLRQRLQHLITSTETIDLTEAAEPPEPPPPPKNKNPPISRTHLQEKTPHHKRAKDR